MKLIHNCMFNVGVYLIQDVQLLIVLMLIKMIKVVSRKAAKVAMLDGSPEL